MARLSKQELDPNREAELVTQLALKIGKMDLTLAESFLTEFFGKEEKLMFAKRLAIIALLNEGVPIHRISIRLHVSESTVAKLYERFERGEFSSTLRTLTKNKHEYRSFVAVLDAIITVGGIMPQRNYILKRRY